MGLGKLRFPQNSWIFILMILIIFIQHPICHTFCKVLGIYTLCLPFHLLQLLGWILGCETIGLNINLYSESHSIEVCPQSLITEPISCAQTLRVMWEHWFFHSEYVVVVVVVGQSENGVPREKKNVRWIDNCISIHYTASKYFVEVLLSLDYNDSKIWKEWLEKNA